MLRYTVDCDVREVSRGFAGGVGKGRREGGGGSGGECIIQRYGPEYLLDNVGGDSTLYPAKDGRK